jgi:hypothetical protein
MCKYVSMLAALLISFSAGQACAERIVRAKPVKTHASSGQKHFRLLRGTLQPLDISDALVSGGLGGGAVGTRGGGATDQQR